MSSGPSNVTSTTRTEAPNELKPALRTASNAITGDFNRMTGGSYGGISPYYGPGDPGSAPNAFGGAMGQYLSNQGMLPGVPAGTDVTSPRPPYMGGTPGLPPGADGAVTGPPATGGGVNSLVDPSQDLISRTIAGDFLNPETNPYLEQTFNRAADLTRNRLDTEFAGGGRNLGASLPARSEELQTLSSNIYGGNYRAERDLQSNALTSAFDFDPVNLLIKRLGGLIPGAGGTTTSTQPVFRTGLFG